MKRGDPSRQPPTDRAVDESDGRDADADGVVVHPIDGVLDLHQFRPADARDLVGDYLDACRAKGIHDVRVIHGKGKGVLRRIVHAVLDRRADVTSYRPADDAGSWGATLVRLADEAARPSPRPRDDGSEASPSRTSATRRGGPGKRSVAVVCGLMLSIGAAGCGAERGGEPAAAPGATGSVAPLELPADDGGPEVVSLLGEPLFRPDLPAERRTVLEDNLAAARADYEANPADEDAIIWYGRRLAYLSRYNDAIAVYSRGIELHPDSYKLRRHRGHRYISVRRFEDAVADLSRAAELAAAEPVEIEPDGAPNALNIPLSNVHFNIWYHLALAHYLRGDFETARDAWLRCMEYSDNDDLRVATSDWLYMTYRRLGEDAAAAAVLEPIDAEMEIIENDAYHRRLLMYKGEVAPEELLDLRASDDPDVALSIATQGYGVGNWYLVNGDRQAAREVFERILEGTSWAAFGYIAAEADLARWDP